ncbi:FMN-binding negative transcriptional regulator [Sphingobium phenoxybenzoativorans]|uniref:FMN-binding negative transcriptional regulator n=1 Tax=Sphingobium phenoxybenzoativorans TaxID=1592790 RepID=UPI000872F6F3|nr:FMN-binding negative transcriptional regulator [Sphingobium phenoxybenzoativorans]
MHPDRNFHWQDRAEMRAFVAETGFGMLFAATPDGPRVAHVPVLFRDEERIAFHLSNGNQITRHLAGTEALFVVNGPHDYISPDWYGMDDQVPTWNYVSVELQGQVTALDKAALADLIDALSTDRESRLAPKPVWTRDKMRDGLFDRMLCAITGFEMRIDAWRGTRKLGQNKPAPAREAAADALDALGSSRLAGLMRKS